MDVFNVPSDAFKTLSENARTQWVACRTDITTKKKKKKICYIFENLLNLLGTLRIHLWKVSI
jgi:hypothetical protein